MKNHVAKMFNDQIMKIGSDIDYYGYSPENTRNKYNEILGVEYLDPIPFRAIVRLSPTKEELEEFGMDANTEMIVKIPILQIQEKELTPTLKDKIDYNGTSYFVNKVNSKGTINNQSVFVVIGCVKGAYTGGK